ncbi:hypothetical protein CANCADRAFT_17904, partial [Tortispora caseinolytica NRRL Y-17796]
KDSRIAIIGCGTFGLSAGKFLKLRGYTDVHMYDRKEPPVPDASSVDINRIIRPDYADPFYAKLALEAQEAWRTTYRDHYKQAGLLVTCAENAESEYQRSSESNMDQLDLNICKINAKSIDHLSNLMGLSPAALAPLNGYLNFSSGWAHASDAIEQAYSECKALGVQFSFGDDGTVIGLSEKDGTVKLSFKSGCTVDVDFVVLATGAWTSGLINTGSKLRAAGQAVGIIELTPEEAAKYAKMPVILDLGSGFYCFPPHPQNNYLKTAWHSLGYQHLAVHDHMKHKLNLPEIAEKVLRDGLDHYFQGEFANREWKHTRICWYTDTHNGNFIIDYYPNSDKIFLATAGNGHAFKFLPIIGDYIVQAIEGTLDPELAQRFRY